MKVKKQHIRVFLEGIEFTSVNSLVMTEAENGPVNFTITTSYVKRIQNLLPKTLCHVFYLHNGEYRFILEGELTNIGFEKSSLQKLCSLQFTGTTLNWRNHYILAKDTSLRFFDRGAFLVLNGEMPFTWDDSEKSVLDRSNPKFSLETSSNSNGYVTNPDIYNPIQSFNQGTWNALLLKLKTPIDVEKILEHTIPKMPKDVFFALLAQESAKDLYFSKNTSSAVDKSIFVNFYKATLRPSNKTGTNLPLYSYQDKVGSNTYKKSPTEYGHTAWGLLQVMGFNLIASPDFTQVEIDTLINGIEYKELVKSQTTLPNSKTPSLGSEYTLFEDQRSGKYFRIPSTEYLVALQCKAAYEQLKRVIFSLSKTAVIDQSLPNQVNVKKIFEYWMGANTNAGRLYANEVYEYFKLAIKEYQTGSLNTNFVGPTEDSYKERYSNAPENPQYETYKNNSERYSFAKEYKPWIKSIVDGGLMITDAKKYIAEALVNNSLEDLVASILDALAITSTYYKTLHQSLPLDVSRVFITDNAPARKLFSYGGMSEFLASRALQGTGGTVISGTDLLK
ncbi:MAG: hypothetical protein KDH96_08615, partial [Candidatus Riesia sp.]|nr:hypothetical protein [Candidatus Riesia sp.]